MLRVRMVRVHNDRVQDLRAWFRELQSRRSEVLATFEQEGTRAESAHLVPGADGPILVYVMDIDDPERARQAFATSTVPIDIEHKRVMKACCDGPFEAELLFECSTGG